MHTFKWENGQWVQQADLQTEYRDGSLYGFRLAITDDGQTLVVTAPGHIEDLIDAGCVITYAWSGSNTWVKQGDCMSGRENDRFGASLDMTADGNYMAVGATGGRYVKVFAKSTNGWVQQGQTIENAANDFGLQVSLSNNGSSLFVTSRAFGSLWHFVFNGSLWTEASTPQLDGIPFESSVSQSFDGRYVAVGSASLQSGQVDVFEWKSNQWQRRGQTLVFDEVNAYFGQFVAISALGNFVAGAGIPHDGHDGVKILYKYNLDNDQWELIQQFEFGKRSSQPFAFSSSERMFVECSPVHDRVQAFALA